MSTGGASRHDSRSSISRSSARPRQVPPPPPLSSSIVDPANRLDGPGLEPCAATAAFLLYAQRDHILVLQHDTLAIERRFALHRERILWIAADNASERGSGRLAVSYDAGSTAIVWDILTGGEVARFSAYEHMRVASFMRNGNLAFGNEQGNIILFEPSTSEHISARTIFDPISALAPSADCRTFAIGYVNGSILVATLQPSFTILHTLTTTRAPAPIAALAWHGSSSKQKTDMLATQTVDGDLRIWSIPKIPGGEQPNIIRVLNRAEFQATGPCWFAWSKNGRIVQHAEGETRAWDVRTKKVSWDVVPTVGDVVGITNYGPTATLFTISRDHFVQQYDITPNNAPVQVCNVQHIPFGAKLEMPEPGDTSSFEDSQTGADRQLTDTEGSSADEAPPLSPLQRIAREMDSLDALESEIRDKVMPLSPVSSRASSTASSRSGHSRRHGRKYLYDKPNSSRASSQSGYEGTEFSIPTPQPRAAHDTMSLRSFSSYRSHDPGRMRSSNNRREDYRAQEPIKTDLFPRTRARVDGIPFRTPHFGHGARTADMLLREMLSVVFGWNEDAKSLVRTELEQHIPGSAGAVLLSKWLGNSGADSLAMVAGTETMTSSDWMLLALTSIGPDSQRQVGEAFVQRLLEKGDVHPAVGILVGLGEHNDAIEVYVSQHFWMEAVLLSCVAFPSDWQRISYLLRKWGEHAVKHGKAELAVRLFSCTSVETTEPWFSPRAQDAVFAAQQERFAQPENTLASMASPPTSPPSRSASGRLTAKNASLKLITSFGVPRSIVPSATDEQTPMLLNGGITPIAQTAVPPSAMSPGGIRPWERLDSRLARDPISAMTATLGEHSGRKRLPSKSDIERAKKEAAQIATPITTTRDREVEAPSTAISHSRRTSSINSLQAPQTAVNVAASLPSPAPGVFARFREQSATRHGHTQDRKPEGLAVQVIDTRYDPSDSSSNGRRANSPPQTGNSTTSSRVRAVDEYVNSVAVAREAAAEKRNRSRQRGESRGGGGGGRSASRLRDPSENRERHPTRHIKPPTRSPSSPIPMSPEEIAEAATKAKHPEPATTDDEQFYKAVDSPRSMRVGKSDERRPSVDIRNGRDSAAVSTTRAKSPRAARGRSSSARAPSRVRSPLSSSPENSQTQSNSDDAQPAGLRARSRTVEGSHEKRAVSRSRRERSSSRKPSQNQLEPLPTPDGHRHGVRGNSTASLDDNAGADSKPRARTLTRKELAAKELEQRRLSLARRPSAPSIPLPGELPTRPQLNPRAYTEQSSTLAFTTPPYTRSFSVDPENMSRYNKMTGVSTTSAPIGLPATPRAMRHPRQMGNDSGEHDDAPPVPSLPTNASQLSSVGSSLAGSQIGPSLVSSVNSNTTTLTSASYNPADAKKTFGEDDDSIGPLLAPTVYGQKPPARSASAPPEKMTGGGGGGIVHHAYKAGIPHSQRRNSAGKAGSNGRNISPPEHSISHARQSSIDETLAQSDVQIINVGEPDSPPPVLAQLQHLAGPPPPPPPPPPPAPLMPPSAPYAMFPSDSRTGSGLINIVMDDNGPAANSTDSNDLFTLPSTTYPHAMERAATAGPALFQTGRGSISEVSQASHTLSSRFKGFGERMRSSSRNRAKSPPPPEAYRPAPYESTGAGPMPPPPPPAPSQKYSHSRGESIHGAKSPYEKAMAAAAAASGTSNGSLNGTSGRHQHQSSRDLFVAPLSFDHRFTETAVPPQHVPPRSMSSNSYRNQKDIRANMPPEAIQPGALGGGAGFL